MLEFHLPHWTQDSTYTKTIRTVLAAVVALMGVINGFTVLQPIRIWRLALLFGVLDQFAPFTPSLWPVVQRGRSFALLLGFFFCIIALGLAHGKRRAYLSYTFHLTQETQGNLRLRLQRSINMYYFLVPTPSKNSAGATRS
jgi:hypothetical protein